MTPHPTSPSFQPHVSAPHQPHTSTPPHPVSRPPIGPTSPPPNPSQPHTELRGAALPSAVVAPQRCPQPHARPFARLCPCPTRRDSEEKKQSRASRGAAFALQRETNGTV